MDVAQLPFANALNQLLPIHRMPALQPGSDFQVLLLRRFAGLDDTPQAGRVWREGFFHENVDPFLDRILKLAWTKTRIASQHRHVTGPQ